MSRISYGHLVCGLGVDGARPACQLARRPGWRSPLGERLGVFGVTVAALATVGAPHDQAMTGDGAWMHNARTEQKRR